MANSSRVAEIFQQASVAFGRLAQLTIDLKLAQMQQADSEQKENVKWSETEIEQLKEAVARFGNDLGKIAEAIETKTVSQIKQKVKSKAFQEAGLSEGEPTEPGQKSEDPVSTTEAPSGNQTPVVDKGRRKQNFEEVSEEQEVSNAKRPRLKEFLDIADPAESKRDKPESERPASLNPPSSADVKNDGVFFKRQVRPNSGAVTAAAGSASVPNANPTGGGVLKTLVNHPASISTKPSIRFDANPTVSDVSQSKYEEYEDGEDGDDTDGYGDYDFDDEDGGEDESARANSDDD